MLAYFDMLSIRDNKDSVNPAATVGVLGLTVM